jgi:hypothetical protein
VETVDERIAFLEGRVVEHSQRLDDIREAIVHLEHRMDRRFEMVDQRFLGLDQRIDTLDGKLSRQFMWIVGVQVTTLVAIVAALMAR